MDDEQQQQPETEETQSEVMEGLRVSSSTGKESRELEVIESDRIELVEQANKLIETLLIKDVIPLIVGNGIKQELDWSRTELQAYNSALTFLTNQFNQGYKDSEVMEKSKESGYTTTYTEKGKTDDDGESERPTS